jgi:hypothetical protein
VVLAGALIRPNRPSGASAIARFAGVTEEHWDGTHPEDENQFAEWQVLLEETVGFGRDSYRWTLTTVVSCADHDDARKHAFELAQRHQPQHPMSPQGRHIFQIGIDTWLVRVPGASQDFHFRVSAARLVDAMDKKGRSLITPA